MITLVTDSEASHHLNLLSQSCRICGNTALRISRTKEKFADELKVVFDINIETDDVNIHPKLICESHSTCMYRYRQSVQEGKPSFITKARLDRVDFSAHDSNCSICYKHGVAPAKRKGHAKSPFGRQRKINKKSPGEPTAIEISGDPVPSVSGKTQSSDYDIGQSLDVEAHPSCNLESSVDKQKMQSFTELLSSMTIDEKCAAAKEFGHQIQEEINGNTDSAGHEMKDLLSLDINENLNKKSMLLSLLTGIIPGSISKLPVRLIAIKEMIQRLVKSSFIGPFSFLCNLVGYSIHNSKLTTNIFGTVLPGGKYKSMTQWLSKSSTEENKCPGGDVIFSFDNEQMVAKTWSVAPNNKTSVSVVTNICVAVVNKVTSIMKDKNLHPMNWFKSEGNEDKVLGLTSGAQESDQNLENITSLHYEQLYLRLADCIQKVSEEIQYTGGSFKDHIDQKVEENRLHTEFKVCTKCKQYYSRRKRVCAICKGPLEIPFSQQPVQNNKASAPKSNIGIRKVTFLPKIDSKKTLKVTKPQGNKPDEEDSYSHVPHNHPPEPHPLLLMDPVNVNPNSYESIMQVLRAIGRMAGVRRYGGSEREFTVVCMDGLPYSMVVQLCRNYICCGLCHAGFLSTSELIKHAISKHGREDIPTYREFNWVIPKVGDGHYESNLFKSFIELNWQVCFSVLCDLMGWKTEKAQKAAKSCTDNHKTWQLILIFYFGTMCELVRPYVISCKEQKIDPTPEGFISYSKGRSDPNFCYMFEMVFRYCQGLLNLRMGVRRNNSNLVLSAKHMTKELFHGRVHPRYQDLELTDSFIRKIMPDQLRYFMAQNETMSRFGNPSTGQGYDFLLEELNKIVKRWVRVTRPTFQMWVDICRNAADLQDLRAKLLVILEEKEPQHNQRKLKLESSVDTWRVYLRNKLYFEEKSWIHRSVSGKELDPGLIDFTISANRKRDYRILELLLPTTGNLPQYPDHTLKHPVYVTQEEAIKFNEMSAQTKETITSTILTELAKITEEALSNYLLGKLNSAKKKDELLTVLYEVMDELEKQTNQALDEDDEDNEDVDEE